MTRKRTLIKKDALSYYMHNDFDLKIWLLFDIIKELMFFCLFYGLYLICHLMDLLIIPVWNAWGYFMCTEVHYGHLLALSSISCLIITNIDLYLCVVKNWGTAKTHFFSSQYREQSVSIVALPSAHLASVSSVTPEVHTLQKVCACKYSLKGDL